MLDSRKASPYTAALMSTGHYVCASLPLAAHSTVLIVDDDPLLLEVLPSMLTRHLSHLSIETCQSPRLAVQKLAKGHYDAAITDLMMPELDGFDILTHVRETRPCTSVIFITGQPAAGIAERAFQEGAFDFVSKPLDRRQLTRSVNLAIKTHRLRRRIEERRVYLTQLREVLSRRWEKPTSIKVTAQVEESPALMGASFDRMEALAKQSEQVIERAERLLRRRQDQMRHHARQRLHSVKQAFEDTDGFT